MPLRRCQGPKGEPGYQAEIDGQVSECFTYDPADLMSQVRAQNAVSRWIEGAQAQAIEQPGVVPAPGPPAPPPGVGMFPAPGPAGPVP